MPVVDRTTFIAGRSPAQVLDFCLEGANFPKIFPTRISPVKGVGINSLRISAGRQFSFRHGRWGVIPATWTLVIREVSALAGLTTVASSLRAGWRQPRALYPLKGAKGRQFVSRA
ncbi:hypothetical protein C4K15_2856 [Pseudomonas chlororaphis subsp. aurantiaca]|nr:hypothetical protein C4K15_2856 [Pseudomonas chlororaphis subsp. aurantiaca]